MTVRAGIRELRQNLSRYVERVKAGETVEVTERGRLVAVLSPAADAEGELRELERRGVVVRPPALDLGSIAPPRRRHGDERAPTDVLADDRAGGRY